MRERYWPKYGHSRGPSKIVVKVELCFFFSMAAFVAAAAGACSPACAAALASTPFSFPVIAALGIATAVTYSIAASNTKEKPEEGHSDNDCGHGYVKTDGTCFL